MNTTLAGWLLRVQEALLGRTTFSLLRESLHRERSAAEFAAWRTTKLLALLEHARTAIPYWRDRLGGWSPPPGASSPAGLLAGVPVLTRSDIRQHLESMRWREAPGKVLVHRSGGTTDDNLTFYWGRERQSWDRAMRYRGFAQLGFAPGDRALHLWPVYPARGLRGRLVQAARHLRDKLTNDVVFDLRGPGGALSPERIDAAIAYCRRYRPAMLIAYPSWLTA